jgi:hypothetical protein
VEVLARYGSAARGDPLYEALVQLGQLLRTVFLADYFLNDAFRRELLRVLNRGELVMAWNTAQMQATIDRPNARRSTTVPPELIGRIAPTRTEGINLRGVFRFPVEAYAERLLPSLPRKASAGGT